MTRVPLRSLRGTLKGGVVLRSPTRTSLAARMPFVLTPRDIELLAAIHLHGLITVEELEIAFFPPSPAGRSGPSTNAHRRLRHLWLGGYARRLEKPVARTLGGSEPYLYALGRAAVAPLARRLAVEPQAIRVRRFDRLNSQFWDHDLKAARLWALVHSHLRQSGAGELWWESERSLRARGLRVVDPAVGRPVAFLPDGYFEVRYASTSHGTEAAPAGETQCCVVEIDMGTRELRQVRRKLGAFELALEEGLFEREWEHAEFEVLVLTTSDARLSNLWRCARETIAAHRWAWYSFATFDMLDRGRFDNRAWLTLEGERVHLLLD